MISTINCPSLKTTYGYDESRLPTNTVTAAATTQQAIVNAINSLVSGGIVVLPAGTYTITSDIVLPDGVYLRGAGIDQTILQASGGGINNAVVYANHKTGIGIQSLTIDSNNVARRGFFAWYAEGVLVDTVKVINSQDGSQGNGVQLRYVDEYSIVNSVSENNTLHGFVSKDAQNDGQPEAVHLADYNAGYQGVGSPYTTDGLIVGNSATGNGDYGLDWHGRNVEIACNTWTNNATGDAKTQDAQGLWYHHNTHVGTGSLPYRISSTISDVAPGSVAENIIWANDFTASNGGAYRYNAPTTDTHLVCNTYNPAATIIVESGATVTANSSPVPADGNTYDLDVNGTITESNTYAYLKASEDDSCTFSQSVSVFITSAIKCLCLKPYGVLPVATRWFVDSTAAPGGDGTDLLPWQDFSEVDYAAILASGDLQVDVAGGATPAQRYTYNDTIVPTIDGIRFDFAGYSELVGPWQETPIPGCAEPVTNTPSPIQSGIVNNVNGLQIVAQEKVGLQIRSWTNAGIDTLRDSSNGLFRNIEVFNNGFADTANEWDFNSPQMDCSGNDYPTYNGAPINFPNRPGVWLAGANHLFDGMVVHDNGQDAFQSRDEGTSSSGGNNLANLRIINSWMYNGRVYNGPEWPNGGPILPNTNVESFNYCSHTDGLQIFANADAGRDLLGTMSGVTIENTWVGPGLSNNLILGEAGRVNVSNVTLNNVVLDRGADNQYLANSGSTATNVTWNNVTSYAGQQAKEHHFQAGNGSSGVSFNNSILAGDGIFAGCADVNLFGSAVATVNGSTASTDVTLNSNAGVWNVAGVSFADTTGGAMGVYNDYATPTAGGANDTTVSDMIGATVSGSPDQFGSYSIT